ncbi:hypothetical protein BGZ80_000770 [Entomortierella chlamydospora]|uniref:Uncharacterized protein n=1 Tax=Entomortierella chlamydospora TaxID=101097 RepID=A0A9P6T427_9FUNG|nr:hypothetical protein BGZ79_006073 [Entomortierella chlamydospora]KAG0022199.1 hypothetical protein BGZ80_000770 [Entomortierella chlamydospora]
MALMMGIMNIFRGLAREYPLIFSPRDINSYIRRSRNIASWSDSLCRISGRAVNPRVKQSLSATFERISTFYPGAPKDDKQLLIECALEFVIYAGIKKGCKLHGDSKIDQDEIERQYWNHCGEKSPAIEDDDQNKDILVISHTANGCIESQDINIHGASRQMYSPDNSLSDFCVPSDEDDEMEYNNNHWSLSDDVNPYSMDLGEDPVGTRQIPSHISRADSSVINFSDLVFSSDSTFTSPMYR